MNGERWLVGYKHDEVGRPNYLIMSENQDELIGVIYNAEHAALVKNAPKLLETCESALIALGDDPHEDPGHCNPNNCLACNLESLIKQCKTPIDIISLENSNV